MWRGPVDADPGRKASLQRTTGNASHSFLVENSGCLASSRDLHRRRIIGEGAESGDLGAVMTLRGFSTEDFLALSPDGMIVCDIGGLIRFANLRVQELAGFEHSALVGHHVEILLPEDLWRRHERYRADYVAAGQPTRSMGPRLTTELRRVDGSTLPVDVALSAFQVGHETMVVVIIRGGTAGQETGPATGEVERRFRQFIEHVSVVAIGLDTEGRVFYANPYFYLLTGFDTEEVLGTDWFSRFTIEGQADDLRRMFREFLAEEAHQRHEDPMVTRDGRPRMVGWFNIRLLDESGDVTGTLAIGEDLTYRRRLEKGLEAFNAVRIAVLEGRDPLEAMQVVALSACELVGASLALVATRDGASDRFTVQAASGESATAILGSIISPPIFGDVVAKSRGRLLKDAGSLFPPPVGSSVGPVILVPLLGLITEGILLVADVPGASSFEDEDLKVLERVGGQAMVAIEYRQRLQRDAVVAERERIARDLHDLIIQRLFDAGLSLRVSAQLLGDEPEIAQRIEQVMGSLDLAIDELRLSIFSLHQIGAEDLRSGVLGVVLEAALSLGFMPKVQVDAMSADVPKAIVGELLSTLREALANVAHHADAHAVEVQIQVGTDLTLIVHDDGRGFPESSAKLGRGLVNMTERAQRLGGDLEVPHTSGGGLTLKWHVPLHSTKGTPSTTDSRLESAVLDNV